MFVVRLIVEQAEPGSIFPLGMLAHSIVCDQLQIHPGRSADVEETEEMSTPTKERGDLIIWNL